MHYNFDTPIGEIIVDVRLEDYRLEANQFLYEIRTIFGYRTFSFHFNGSRGDFEFGITRLTREQVKWALKLYLYKVLDGAVEYEMFCRFNKLENDSWGSHGRYLNVRSEFITVSSVFGTTGDPAPVKAVLEGIF